MSLNDKLLKAAAAAAGGITPSEHFAVVLYEGDGSSSHSINGGKFGAGAYFNGSSSKFNTGVVLESTTFSASVWFRTSVSGKCIIGNIDTSGPTANDRDGFTLLTDNYSIYNNDAFVVNSASYNAGSLADGNWHHIVITNDGSNSKIYIDGSLDRTDNSSGWNSLYSQDIYLGFVQRSPIVNFFDGKIDQVRIFQKVLSSSEVSTLYAETVDTVESLDPLSEDTTDTLQVLGDSSCIATYRFENNEDDESGNYDGTGVNVQYAAGRYGQSARFGNSSYVDLGTITRTSSMTLSAWVKTTSSNLPVVYLDNGAVFRLGIDNSGYAMASNLDGTNATSTTTVTNGSWNHIVAVFNDSGFRRIYVNSSLENSQTYTSGTRTYKDGIAIDNNNPASSQIDIDQVRIFNKALSASEVTTLYNENSLVASYRFEGNANDDTRNYDGTASNVTYEYGLNFTPDFVWIKKRDAAENHRLYDSTRGVSSSINTLYPSLNFAASTESPNGLASLDTGGFTVQNQNAVNSNGNDFVAWCLKANGGTTSSNTDGTITSTVQVNETAGFSIVKYTGNNTANATIGHGLSSTPQFIISKNLDNGSAYWATYHHSIGITRKFYLNDTSIGDTVSGGWLDVSPTLITLKQINANNINENGSDFINYCFTEVDGFSKFGSYEGNGTTEGPMVETGFEPAFIIIKDADGADNWAMVDNKRATTNPRQTWLRANLSNAEFSNTVDSINFYSNGFQVAGGTSVSNFLNESGNTFIYMAFAADPDTEVPTLAKSFSTVTYTGNGGTQSITGVGFKPNLIWLKNRTDVVGNRIIDSIWGPNYYLESDTTAAKTGAGTAGLTSFDSDGFSVGSGNAHNGSGDNIVAWAWKADDNEPTIEGGPAKAVYKFEDNGNDVTGGLNLTESNMSYSSSGKFNKAAEFNGNNSSFTNGSITGLPTGTSPVSVSYWIYTDTSNQSAGLVGYGRWNTGGTNSGAANKYFGTMLASGDLFFAGYYYNTAFSPAVTLPTGQWNHLVWTFDGTNVRAYLNGSLAGTVNRSSLDIGGGSGNLSITIGRNSWSGTGSEHFDGKIDQVRIYSGKLEDEQVSQLYAETVDDNDDLILGGPPETIISANANAGFSIVKYEGNGLAGKQVPHGLSAAPEFVIIKQLDTAGHHWKSIAAILGAGQALYLNLTNAATANQFNNTLPTSTVFTLDTDTNVNENGQQHIAYCFHSVAGYSKIGTYSGNNTSTSVTTGFQPDFVMLKRTTAIGNWNIWDSVRNGSSSSNDILYPNKSDAETDAGSGRYIIFNSNGFTIYGDSGDSNANGHTYMYMAFKIN